MHSQVKSRETRCIMNSQVCDLEVMSLKVKYFAHYDTKRTLYTVDTRSQEWNTKHWNSLSHPSIHFPSPQGSNRTLIRL
ncbi:hypothetical protein RHMOL_Rhmol02G0168800 [Rhododendron molle]|uniref:Uncharacterized protein n=1 Tax=Rhododendron molle TaxID=49168 RepID=A0ACC0PQS2_RHOML|nr:hypothetical protein RHMOL_Rhmol02G0168800 [Rhododendron molle]